MPMKTIAIVVLSFVLSSYAIAQKNEVSLSVGPMFTESQKTIFPGVGSCAITSPNCGGPFETKVGTSVAIEGSYVRNLYTFGPASMAVEFPVVGVPSRTATTTVLGAPAGTASLSSLFLTPAVRFKWLSSGRVSPFVSFGAGLAHFSSAGTANHSSLQFGGGLDFRTPVRRLAIRGELRDFWAGGLLDSGGTVASPRQQHNVFAGAGVVVKF